MKRILAKLGRLKRHRTSSICPVCRHLDPYSSPKRYDEETVAWALKEFQRATDLYSSTVEIDDPQQLIKRAASGCPYCRLISDALSRFHPGWDGRPCSIDLMLGTDLPLVVRLNPGRRWREGTELKFWAKPRETDPREMDLICTHTVSELETEEQEEQPEPDDIEIYVPRTPQSVAGQEEPHPSLPYVGYAVERPFRSDADVCFRFAAWCVKTCQGESHSCRGGDPPLLPDRVLYVGEDDTSGIRLLEPRAVRAHYLTLSYCWGGPQAFTTEKATLRVRKMGIAYQELPPLFQDVVSVARRLGIKYVWIDSLCIIQHDTLDFNIQAPKMGEIYANSILTLAAASARSPNDRILVARDRKWFPQAVDFHAPDGTVLNLRARRRSCRLFSERAGGDYGDYSTRAWIWQERLLATRTIFFTEAALKFECHSASMWEDQLPWNEGHSWSALLEDKPHESWTRLMEDYTSRGITKPSDRLPALSSVTKRIEKKYGCSAVAGLWRQTLVESLAWNPRVPHNAKFGTAKPHENYIAPTWSWASVEGPVTWDRCSFGGPIFNPAETQWSLEVIDISLGNQYGVQNARIDDCRLTVAGYLIPAALREQVSENTRGQKSSIYQIGRDQSDFFLPGGRSETMAFVDVALEPFRGVIDGVPLSTTVRAPRDSPQCSMSRISNCHLLLLARNRGCKILLILGRSLRMANTWERLGTLMILSNVSFPPQTPQRVTIV